MIYEYKHNNIIFLIILGHIFQIIVINNFLKDNFSKRKVLCYTYIAKESKYISKLRTKHHYNKKLISTFEYILCEIKFVPIFLLKPINI